jgi:hypothetical protein
MPLATYKDSESISTYSFFLKIIFNVIWIKTLLVLIYLSDIKTISIHNLFLKQDCIGDWQFNEETCPNWIICTSTKFTLDQKWPSCAPPGITDHDILKIKSMAFENTDYIPAVGEMLWQVNTNTSYAFQ